MIYNLVDDTVVLLFCWNRRLSCGVCFHIVVAVGKVHDVVEVLDPLFSATVYQLRRSGYFVVLPSVQKRSEFAAVSVLLFLYPWLFDDSSAIGCVRSFSC